MENTLSPWTSTMDSSEMDHSRFDNSDMNVVESAHTLINAKPGVGESSLSSHPDVDRGVRLDAGAELEAELEAESNWAGDEPSSDLDWDPGFESEEREVDKPIDGDWLDVFNAEGDRRVDGGVSDGVSDGLSSRVSDGAIAPGAEELSRYIPVSSSHKLGATFQSTEVRGPLPADASNTTDDQWTPINIQLVPIPGVDSSAADVSVTDSQQHSDRHPLDAQAEQFDAGPVGVEIFDAQGFDDTPSLTQESLTQESGTQESGTQESGWDEAGDEPVDEASGTPDEDWGDSEWHPVVAQVDPEGDDSDRAPYSVHSEGSLTYFRYYLDQPNGTPDYSAQFDEAGADKSRLPISPGMMGAGFVMATFATGLFVADAINQRSEPSLQASNTSDEAKSPKAGKSVNPSRPLTGQAGTGLPQAAKPDWSTLKGLNPSGGSSSSPALTLAQAALKPASKSGGNTAGTSTSLTPASSSFSTLPVSTQLSMAALKATSTPNYAVVRPPALPPLASLPSLPKVSGVTLAAQPGVKPPGVKPSVPSVQIAPPAPAPLPADLGNELGQGTSPFAAPNPATVLSVVEAAPSAPPSAPQVRPLGVPGSASLDPRSVANLEPGRGNGLRENSPAITGLNTPGSTLPGATDLAPIQSPPEAAIGTPLETPRSTAPIVAQPSPGKPLGEIPLDPLDLEPSSEPLRSADRSGLPGAGSNDVMASTAVRQAASVGASMVPGYTERQATQLPLRRASVSGAELGSGQESTQESTRSMPVLFSLREAMMAGDRNRRDRTPGLHALSPRAAQEAMLNPRVGFLRVAKLPGDSYQNQWQLSRSDDTQDAPEYGFVDYQRGLIAVQDRGASSAYSRPGSLGSEGLGSEGLGSEGLGSTTSSLSQTLSIQPLR